MRLEIRKKQSKSGSVYCCLVLVIDDANYRVLSFDMVLLSELSNLSVSALNALKVGDTIFIGDVIK